MNVKKQSERFIELFQNRFGTNHIEYIKEKVSDIDIKYEEVPFSSWWGMVDENGSVKINTMSNIPDIHATIMHELMHKLNRFKDENGEEQSHFYKCPDEYEQYIGNLIEYMTEYLALTMLKDSRFTYLEDGKNIVKTPGLRSAYSKGINIIEGLCAVVGEEKILDLYVGEIDINQFIHDFDKKFGKGEMLNFVKKIDSVRRNLDNSYNEVIDSLLNKYIQNQEKNNEGDREEISNIEKQIEQFINILPIHLDEEESNLDKKIKIIQENYIKKCKTNSIIPKDFVKEQIDEGTKQMLSDLGKAKKLRPDENIKLFEYEIKCDETKDVKNNLYRILNQIAFSGQRIEDLIIQGEDKYLMDILKKVKQLSPNIESDVDIEKYRGVYEYIYTYLNVNMIKQFQKGEKGNAGEYLDYRGVFYGIKANSIHDTKNKEVVGNIKDSVNLYNLLLKANVNKNEELYSKYNDKNEYMLRTKNRLISLEIDDAYITDTEEEYYSKKGEKITNKEI